MTILFEDIMSNFLLHVDDIAFMSYDESFANQIFLSWLKSAVSKPYVVKLFSSFTIQEDNLTIECELSHPVKSELYLNYITDILALGVRIEWLQQKVASTTSLLQVFGGKEEKFFSQGNHLGESRAFLLQLQREQRLLISEYLSNNNSYI